MGVVESAELHVGRRSAAGSGSGSGSRGSLLQVDQLTLGRLLHPALLFPLLGPPVLEPDLYLPTER